MKKIFILCLSLCVSAALWAQQTIEDANAEKRTVSGFHSIKVTDGIDLYLSQGDDESVAVSAAREEYRSRIRTVVEEGVLRISYNRETLGDWTSGGKKLKAYVSFKTLQKLTAAAGAAVTLQETVKLKATQMYINSGAVVRGELEVGKLILEIESGGAANLTGAAGELHVNANSGGRLSAYELSSGKADLRCSSGAKMEVTVSDELKVDASSGGNIRYRGTARLTEVNTRSGSVVRSEKG